MRKMPCLFLLFLFAIYCFASNSSQGKLLYRKKRGHEGEGSDEGNEANGEYGPYGENEPYGEYGPYGPFEKYPVSTTTTTRMTTTTTTTATPMALGMPEWYKDYNDPEDDSEENSEDVYEPYLGNFGLGVPDWYKEYNDPEDDTEEETKEDNQENGLLGTSQNTDEDNEQNVNYKDLALPDWYDDYQDTNDNADDPEDESLMKDENVTEEELDGLLGTSQNTDEDNDQDEDYEDLALPDWYNDLYVAENEYVGFGNPFSSAYLDQPVYSENSEENITESVTVATKIPEATQPQAVTQVNENSNSVNENLNDENSEPDAENRDPDDGPGTFTVTFKCCFFGDLDLVHILTIIERQRVHVIYC